MSNTPTESEFDIRALHTVFAQEIRNILYSKAGISQIESDEEATELLDRSTKAIIVAVDKHVIGEDSQDNQVIVHYPGGVVSHGGRVKEYGPSVSSGANIFSVTNNKLRAEQRKALYGGDKK